VRYPHSARPGRWWVVRLPEIGVVQGWRRCLRATTPAQPVSPRTPLAEPSLHLPRPVVDALAAAGVARLGAAWSMTDAELLARHWRGPEGRADVPLLQR
jgi:hypothetical protein